MCHFQMSFFPKVKCKSIYAYMDLISPQLLTISNVIMKNPLWPTSSLIGSSHRLAPSHYILKSSHFCQFKFWNLLPLLAQAASATKNVKSVSKKPKVQFTKFQAVTTWDLLLRAHECVQIFATQIAHFVQNFYNSISSFLQQNCSM